MVATSVAPEIPVSNLIPVEKKRRHVRYCFPICRALFHRRRQRKVDTENRNKVVEVLECQDQIMAKVQEFEQKEPSEWHLPTDWAIEIKELPKVNAQGGKIKMVSDFFSLRPIRNISSNIIPKIRSSNGSHARSSISQTNRSARPSLTLNDGRSMDECQTISSNFDSNGDLIKSMSMRFLTGGRNPFTGGLLSSKMKNTSSKKIQIISSIVNLSANSDILKCEANSSKGGAIEIITETLDKTNSANETLPEITNTVQ